MQGISTLKFSLKYKHNTNFKILEWLPIKLLDILLKDLGFRVSKYWCNQTLFKIINWFVYNPNPIVEELKISLVCF